MNSTDGTKRLKKLIKAISSFPVWLILLACIAAGLTVTLVAVSDANENRTSHTRMLLRKIRDRIDLVGEIRTQLLNAETAQRGFLLTGTEEYLQPLNEADNTITKLKAQISTPMELGPNFEKQMISILDLIDRKLIEVHVVIQLTKEGNRDAALQMISENKGKLLMAEARATIAQVTTMLDSQMRRLNSEMDHNLLLSRLSILVIA